MAECATAFLSGADLLDALAAMNDIEWGALQALLAMGGGTVPGPGTDSQQLQFMAEATLSGHRLVMLADSGRVAYASNAQLGHAGLVLGMTTGAAMTGAAVNVHRSGPFTEPSWSWTPDAPLFLGADGLFTQEPPQYPAAAFSLVVGFALTPTKILVGIHEPIILS